MTQMLIGEVAQRQAFGLRRCATMRALACCRHRRASGRRLYDASILQRLEIIGRRSRQVYTDEMRCCWTIFCRARRRQPNGMT
jgi:hypothetical protein